MSELVTYKKLHTILPTQYSYINTINNVVFNNDINL